MHRSGAWRHCKPEAAIGVGLLHETEDRRLAAVLGLRFKADACLLDPPPCRCVHDPPRDNQAAGQNEVTLEMPGFLGDCDGDVERRGAGITGDRVQLEGPQGDALDSVPAVLARLRVLPLVQHRRADSRLAIGLEHNAAREDVVDSFRCEGETAAEYRLTSFLGPTLAKDPRDVLRLRNVSRGREGHQSLVPGFGNDQGHDPVARQAGNREAAVGVGVLAPGETPTRSG